MSPIASQDDNGGVLRLKTGPLQLEPSPPLVRLEDFSETAGAEAPPIVSDDEEVRFIVQFNALPTRREIEELRSMGLTLDQFLDGTSYYASGSSRMGATATEQSENIRALKVLTAESKVSPDLLSQRMVAEEAANGQADVTIEVFDVAGIDAIAASVEALGGEVVEIRRAALALTARISLSQVNSLAGFDDVKFIEPAPAPRQQFNDGVRANLHVDKLHDDHSLTGAGITVGVWDGGKIDAHGDFGDRLTVAEPDAPTNDHATHVAGTLGGDGSQSAARNDGSVELLLLANQEAPPVFSSDGQIVTIGEEITGEERRMVVSDEVSAAQWRGVAPGAGIVSFFWDNADDDHEKAIEAFAVDVSQNSWGFGVDEARFNNCNDYGNYTADAAAYDRIVTGLFGRNIPIVFAAGNERNDRDCGMAPPPADNFAVITPPQTAKNVITVGAINSDDDSLTEFTSYGPTDDGRLKPDIVTAGCEANGARVVTSTIPGGLYGGKCGTSMAAPAVSGLVALLMERRRAVGRGEALPSSYKAILVHSAVDLDNVGPDYRSGYGKLDAERAFDITERLALTEAEIEENGRTLLALLDVPDTSPELKVTLSWDDEAAATNALFALVNDLDLRLVAPDGTEHLPWILDPDDPAAPAARGRDGLNVLEQVQVPDPAAGQWRIEIAGRLVPTPPQPFSLVVTTD